MNFTGMAPTDDLVRRLYRRANADRWSVPLDAFRAALERAAFALRASAPKAREIEVYLSSLHLEDLALACACAAGNESAWEHFIREYRPHLYRAADALDAQGGARELADAIYADLYGLQERDGERRSLLHYFHGRSSLSTWLRAVLAQRHVDHVRSGRRFEPVADDECVPSAAGLAADPDRARYLTIMQQALDEALCRLAPRDRLRLRCYYAQELSLAETGRILREHEATVSRQLARTRRAVREDVERWLREEAGFAKDEVARCFRSTAEDAGSLDLDTLLREDLGRKNRVAPRSMTGESL